MCVNSTVTILNSARIAYDPASIVIHATFYNVVSEIRFRHPVSWIYVHSQIKCTVCKVRAVHPLAVDSPTVEIITSRRYALTSVHGAVEFFIKSLVTIGIFQTKAGFVALSNFLAAVFLNEVI